MSLKRQIFARIILGLTFGFSFGVAFMVALLLLQHKAKAGECESPCTIRFTVSANNLGVAGIEEKPDGKTVCFDGSDFRPCNEFEWYTETPITPEELNAIEPSGYEVMNEWRRGE